VNYERNKKGARFLKHSVVTVYFHTGLEIMIAIFLRRCGLLVTLFYAFD